MARVIVRQRGTARRDRPNRPVQVRLSEPGRRRVVELLRDLLEECGQVHEGDGEGPLIRLDARATELLGTPPALGDPLPGCPPNR
jgi:hypothetical protein